jgi:hypothetical protein
MHAVSMAKHPRVLADYKEVKDFSERGPLTQKGILGLRDLEVRDGTNLVLGFHAGPQDMRVSAEYSDLVSHCKAKGWLKVQR